MPDIFANVLNIKKKIKTIDEKGSIFVRNLDNYGSKHTGSHKNIQAKIGGTCERKKTHKKILKERAREKECKGDILEGKGTISQRYEDYTFERKNISLV